jgi:type I restriction enzyme S subunit
MELAASGTTGSHQRISPSSALNIAISIPLDPSEQTAIATILSDMDAEITALEARRDKTRDIKQGMMQELLTGRIRLV